jgi:HK97 family phage prohead protease
MPIPKPKEGQSQASFMQVCMHEAAKNEDRTNEQNVAICLGAWREKHPGAAKPKSDAEVQRIIKLWCRLLAKQGSAMDVPEPDDGESMADFKDRCVEELTDNGVDDDDADDACELAWQDYNEESGAHSDLIIKSNDQAKASDGMEYILSDATPDRFGDIVDPKGWEYASFLRHPIALFNHNADFPVGIWKNIRVDDALRGHLALAPKGTSARIDEIRALVDAGILKAVSVGFKSIKSEPIHPDSGRGDPFGFGPKRYLQQELVECSLVSIPANPNALAVAKSLRISSDTQRLVFGEHADRRHSTASTRRGEHASTRRSATGEHARTSATRRGTMPTSLSQRITDTQERIVEARDELSAHLDRLDDSNVSETDLQKTNDLNAIIAQRMKTLASLQDAEKALGGTATAADGGGSRAVTVRERGNGNAGNGHVSFDAAEIERRKQFFQATSGAKELQPLDYVVRAGVVTYLARVFQRPPEEICRTYTPYNDEKTRFMVDYNMRAATNPAITTVTGWAAELVQQVYGAFMELLLPKSVFPRLSARGISMQFGRAGRIIIPTRNATPTIAGSFVGEGAPIPVRQGQFTSFTLTPKKLAVISTWTKEMDEHSIPAIEGLLRDAIQTDTAIAVDSVLMDSNPATTIRPAGLFNGVAPLTPTAIAGGAFAAIVGDLKQLINALIVATKGNVRNPTWLMNPGNINSASFITFPNFTWAFRQEIQGGTLNGYPIIDSGTVPLNTVAIIDAADFVTAGEEAPRFEVSDQATLHEEDTTPLPIVASGGTAASPVRSLWQTDSLALRMIYRLNWTMRRTGMVAWVQNVTW